MRIEFLWFDDCPNHERARALLDEVLRENGIDPASVKSIRVDEASAVAHRFAGSPTIRVDGCDIEPGFQDDGEYSLACRLPGVPQRDWIAAAIGAPLQSEKS